MRVFNPFVALILSLSVSACGPHPRVATAQSAKSGFVEVITTPAGAIVTNDLGTSCITPCNLGMSRADGGSILISLDGYRTQRRFVGSRLAIARGVNDSDFESSYSDPETEALAAAFVTLVAKDEFKTLDENKVEVALAPLADGELDPLAPDVPLSGDLFSSYRPITGERIPIDISEPESNQ